MHATPRPRRFIHHLSPHLTKRLIALTVLTLLLAGTMASPAVAAKKAEPAATGVVERFETIGGHVILPTPLDIDGETRGILTVVGWDAALPSDEGDDGFGAFCGDQPPVFNGVEQLVVTPAGNVQLVVHNADIPVLLFDVTDVESEEDFHQQCSSGQLQPFAHGTLKQRPILNITDTGLTIMVKSQGVVSDTTGQQWRLDAFLREVIDFTDDGPPAVQSWVKLRKL